MAKVAVVGVGRWGQNHARVLHELGALAGVCDVDGAVAARVAGRFGVPAWGKVSGALGPGVDAVVVAAPTDRHRELALAAIGAGKHVLVEKPMTGDLEEAREIADAAGKQGVVLAVGHIERHNPAVQYVHKGMVSGQYGRVISMLAKRVSSFPGRVQDMGVVGDLAIHDIDVMRFLTRGKVEAVFASGGSQMGGRHEDFANIMLMFEGGLIGVMETNWLTPVKIRMLKLTCSQKYVEADYIGQTVDVSSSTLLDLDPTNLFQIPQEYDHRHVTLKKQEPLKNELKDFLEAIEKQRKPLVNGEDGIEGLRVVGAALESIRDRKVVEMKEGQ